MKTLHINVQGNVATYSARDGYIVCGNDENYKIEFSLDSDWAALTGVTVRFIWNGRHFDRTMQAGNTCEVPELIDTEEVEVGLFTSTKRTTTGAKIPCRRSILCRSTKPSADSDRNYANEAMEAADRAEAAAELAATYVPKDGSGIYIARTGYDHAKGEPYAEGTGTMPPGRYWQVGDLCVDEYDSAVYRVSRVENGAAYLESLNYTFMGEQGPAGENGKDGANGKTPVKGTDYYTDADKAEIVRMVIESLGGNPVFGYVDQSNNIIMSGNLANGSYSVKYEMEDGSTIDIGELTLGKEPINNLAGTISVGRLGSDGTIRNDAPDCRVTDYVSVKNGDIVRVKGIVFSETPAYPSAVYNNSKSKLSSVALVSGSNTYYTVNSTTDNGAQITIISSDVAFVRFSGKPTGADEDIIVTVNQEIE